MGGQEKDGEKQEDQRREKGSVSPEQLDRNWNELLQELRVVQTGVQILTAFLLTVPFSQRFGDLNGRQVTAYLCVLSGSVLTTALVIAPVAFHRVLFRRHERHWLVQAANRSARAGLVMLVLTSAGMMYLVFDVVLGLVAGLVVAGVVVVVFVLLWGVVPWLSHWLDADPPDS